MNVTNDNWSFVSKSWQHDTNIKTYKIFDQIQSVRESRYWKCMYSSVLFCFLLFYLYHHQLPPEETKEVILIYITLKFVVDY